MCIRDSTHTHRVKKSTNWNYWLLQIALSVMRKHKIQRKEGFYNFKYNKFHWCLTHHNHTIHMLEKVIESYFFIDQKRAMGKSTVCVGLKIPWIRWMCIDCLRIKKVVDLIHQVMMILLIHCLQKIEKGDYKTDM